MNYIKVNDLDFPEAYVQMFDLLDECILIVDIKGRIVLINSATEELDEISREETIGQYIDQVYTPDRYISATSTALEERRAVVDMMQNYTTLHGKNIITISSSYPLVSDGKMVGVMTLTKDISRFNEIRDIFSRHSSGEIEEVTDGPAYTFDQMIGESRIFKNTLKMAEKASKTMSNVLIYGETGTGKELFAQSIHNASQAKGKFVPINCAAIPENLLESLLFGTSKGAYTGAVDSVGLFKEADGGTLFLDELNSMSMNLQAKILRAVETQRIRRIGETKEEEINLRVLSALNVPPEEAIEKGRLRRDLYYRLGVVTLTIPPLRDRIEDIDIYVQKFVEENDRKYFKKTLTIDEEILEAFKKYDWPGNVRELQHAVEHIHIMSGDDGRLKASQMPSFILEKEVALKSSQSQVEKSEYIDLDKHMWEIEREIIEDRLEEYDGNISRAAESLGLSRQTLSYRLGKI